MKAIWGETKSQEVMVHFSGISFACMYGSIWGAGLALWQWISTVAMKLNSSCLFVFKIKGMHWFFFFLMFCSSLVLLEKSCSYKLSYLLLSLEFLYAISTQFGLAFWERVELNHASPKSQTCCLLYPVPDFRNCNNMPGGWYVFIIMF